MDRREDRSHRAVSTHELKQDLPPREYIRKPSPPREYLECRHAYSARHSHVKRDTPQPGLTDLALAIAAKTAQVGVSTAIATAHDCPAYRHKRHRSPGALILPMPTR